MKTATRFLLIGALILCSGSASGAGRRFFSRLGKTCPQCHSSEATGSPTTKKPAVSDKALQEKVLALIQELKDKDFMVRSRAAVNLAGIGPAAKEATSALIQGLEDDKMAVRCRAAFALRKIIGPEAGHAIPALTKAINDESGYVRRGAVGALGSIGEAAVPALVDALSHENVRRSTISVLGRLGPRAKAADPALSELLKNEKDEQVKKRIESTLKAIRKEIPANDDN